MDAQKQLNRALSTDLQDCQRENEQLRKDKARLWLALERLCQIAEFRGLVIGPQDARKLLAEIKA